MEANMDIWRLKLTEKDLMQFSRPYIGNGYLGIRFDRLLIAPWSDEPLSVLTSEIYAGGRQLVLPSWLQADIRVNGHLYCWDCGVHQLEQILDVRTGMVMLQDRWEYADGKTADISMSLLVPRGFRNSSLLNLKITADGADIHVIGGLNANYVGTDFNCRFTGSDNVITGNYVTVKEPYEVIQYLGWNGNGLGTPEIVLSEQQGQVKFTGHDVMSLELRQLVVTAEDPDNSFMLLPLCGIVETNASEWASLWSRSLQIEKLSESRRLTVNLMQFYLLCSLNDCDSLLGPLGLSGVGWAGAQFWDTDFWIFRAILPLWPELAATTIRYRHKSMDQARVYAEQHGLPGLLFSWKTDDRGRSVALPFYEKELHINIWVALAVLDHYHFTGDLDFYRRYGHPLLTGIADALYARGKFEADGNFHICDVIGPDEAVCEKYHRHCDDNFITNYGTSMIFHAVTSMTNLLGETAAPEWLSASAKMFLPEPDLDDIIPEYQGYDGGDIKQADLILAFYPLEYNPGPQIILKNLQYYQKKCMKEGPFMNASIESCIMMRNGLRQEGIERLFTELDSFCRSKYQLLSENPGNDNTVFLTGIGGFLQALYFGYLKENHIIRFQDQ